MFDFSVLPQHLQESLKVFMKNNVQTPIIICSKDQIATNLSFFLQQLKLKRSDIYFPVKVNHAPAILNYFNDAGTNFEIASVGELFILEKLKIPAGRIMFSNPVKIPDHIKCAYKYGVQYFAFDTETELQKIALNAPQSSVYARISISNTGAQWTLNQKFGIPENKVVGLMKRAIEFNLKPVGIAFHVGWNNKNTNTYKEAIQRAADIFHELKQNGISLEFMNIGGGFPAHDGDPYPLLQKIASEINPDLEFLKKQFGIRIIAEPGSFLTADTSALICSVADVIKRKNKSWIFLDSGINQGFQWILSGIRYQVIYPYKTSADTTLKKFIITGPTCDSHDVFSKDIALPEHVKTGDKMLVFPAGAYINSAERYNGFEYPDTFFS